MSDKEGTWQDLGICASVAPARKLSPCEELEGTGTTEELCEGKDRVWALLGEKTSGAGAPRLMLPYQRLAWVVVALGTNVEKGMRKSWRASPEAYWY